MRSGEKGALEGAGSWIAHRLTMRSSPAWRALPDNARRILDRLEIEHMRHGGAENGRLACTYAVFEEAGIRRASIPLAIRQCVELGFLEVTRPGWKSAAGTKFASLYRLTYPINMRRHGEKRALAVTDEWERITTEDDARSALERAKAASRYTRKPLPPESIDRRLKNAPSSRAPRVAKTRLAAVDA